VIPSESSQVTAVSSTGVLTLAHPLARPFSSPSIAKVTSLATVNVGVNNLVIEGALPLNVNEVFGFTATGDTFISDTNVGGGNVYEPTMNDIRGFTISHSTFTSNGPLYMLELPQRNSQDGVVDSNTFHNISAGTAEYGAHWKITNNTFNVAPNVSNPVGVAFGGWDMLFSGNHVIGTTGGVQLPLVIDSDALNTNPPWVGQIRILNNIFDCAAPAATCLDVVSVDAVMQGNQFNVTGAASQGILVEGGLPQSVQITANTITVQNGVGMVVNSPKVDHSVISCNTVTGSGPIGVYIATTAVPQTGADTVSGNTVTGFGTPIAIDPTMHPGTVINYSTTGCAGQ
jgi:hypothetical protein